MSEIQFTKHANERMDEMNVTVAEVVHVLRSPETDYPGPKRHGDNRVATSGDLAVSYTTERGIPLVLTILWNKKDARHEHSR